MDMLDHPLNNRVDTEVVELVDSKEMLSQELTIAEENSLGSGSEDQGSTSVAHLSTQHLLDTSGDDEVQYAFRSNEGGTVTYRVVQVDDSMDQMPQIVSASSFGAPVSQVLTGPLNGQLYVIGNTGEVFASGTQRTIAPRSNSHQQTPTIANNLKKRDDRRRATHNEVERRRRDKINNWIMKLSKIIPDSTPEVKGSGGSHEGQSKGGILMKACEYILELRQSNQRLADCRKENEQLVLDIEVLKQNIDQLKREKAHLEQKLLHANASAGTSSSS